MDEVVRDVILFTRATAGMPAAPAAHAQSKQLPTLLCP